MNIFQFVLFIQKPAANVNAGFILAKFSILKILGRTTKLWNSELF